MPFHPFHGVSCEKTILKTKGFLVIEAGRIAAIEFGNLWKLPALAHRMILSIQDYGFKGFLCFVHISYEHKSNFTHFSACWKSSIHLHIWLFESYLTSPWFKKLLSFWCLFPRPPRTFKHDEVLKDASQQDAAPLEAASPPNKLLPIDGSGWWEWLVNWLVGRFLGRFFFWKHMIFLEMVEELRKFCWITGDDL